MLSASLAATHLPTGLALALGAMGLAGMAWYWTQLGDHAVPRPRRLIRRLSLVSGVVTVAAAVLGFGIVDPDVRPVPYVVAWGVGGLALGVTVLFAVLDAVVSMRIHRDDLVTWRQRRVEDLNRAIQEARDRRGEGRS